MWWIFSIAMFITAICTKEFGYLYASGLFAIADSVFSVARHLDKKD